MFHTLNIMPFISRDKTQFLYKHGSNNFCMQITTECESLKELCLRFSAVNQNE